MTVPGAAEIAKIVASLRDADALEYARLCALHKPTILRALSPDENEVPACGPMGDNERTPRTRTVSVRGPFPGSAVREAEVDCPICSGRGWYEGVESGCCQRPTPSGECCGQAIAVQVQEQCSACGGSGKVQSPTSAGSGTDARDIDSDNETYRIGKEDGYTAAIQELDLATGGDGEFRGSTFPGETVDVPVMRQRIIDRAITTPAKADDSRDEAARRVIATRGSNDVPGFDACVNAEMEAIGQERAAKADDGELDKRIEDIVERLSASTPRPWGFTRSNSGEPCPRIHAVAGHKHIAECGNSEPWVQAWEEWEANADLLTNAPDDLEFLIAAMRRLLNASPATRNEAGAIWVRHAGDVCPVPSGTLVRVRYRDGGLSPVVHASQEEPGARWRDAESRFWKWRNESGHHSDIVAFQLASVAPPPAAGEVTDEWGWLIEHGASEVSRPRYWGGVHGWTFDNLKAVRFAREEDARSIAESMDDGVPNNYRIKEHGWS